MKDRTLPMTREKLISTPEGARALVDELTEEMHRLDAKCERMKAALKDACSCRPGGGYCSACRFLYEEDRYNGI